MIDRLQLPILALAAPGAADRQERRDVPDDMAQKAAPDAGAGAQVASYPPRAVPARYLSRRPDPAFLAQVIATSAGLPQTRQRRQCDPAEAALAYMATSKLIADAKGTRDAA